MKQPKNGGEFWGFDEESDEDNYSFDEDEENTAGFKPILKVRIINVNLSKSFSFLLHQLANCMHKRVLQFYKSGKQYFFRKAFLSIRNQSVQTQKINSKNHF